MKRHRFDVISMFFGLLFIGLAGTWAFGDEDITLLELKWVWPVLLVVAGLAIVAFSVQRSVEADRGEHEVEPALEAEAIETPDITD